MWDSLVNCRCRHHNSFSPGGGASSPVVGCGFLWAGESGGEQRTLFSFDSPPGVMHPEALPRWTVRGLPEGWQMRLPQASASCSQWPAQPTYTTPRGFIHQGDPGLQQNTAMILPCLLQKSKCAHLALRRTQGVLGKQKWEESSPSFLGGFRVLGRQAFFSEELRAAFLWVFLPNCYSAFSTVSPSSPVIHLLQVVLSVSNFKLQDFSFPSASESFFFFF